MVVQVLPESEDLCQKYSYTASVPLLILTEKLADPGKQAVVFDGFVLNEVVAQVTPLKE